jgi:methylated-DNA-protein-cysteine methyltransferase-like protein
MPKQPNPIFANIREMILKIPRGKVSTYGAVAAAAGYPRGARLTVRALSQAHGLPWHRVVAAGGRIATPGEHALDQRFRLEMEGVKFSGRKVRMTEFEHQFPRKGKAATKSKKKSAKKIVGKTASSAAVAGKKIVQKKSAARKNILERNSRRKKTTK